MRFKKANPGRRISAVITRFALACTLVVSASVAHANGALSGSWYNPDRNYEGFEFQVLENGDFLIIFYTYPGPTDDNEAKQSFILGVGTLDGNIATIVDAYRTKGPIFGEGYDKDDLVVETWGDFTVEFFDDDNARVDYAGADGSGSTNVTRLTALAQGDNGGSLPPGISAIWYDPETNGQGWFVEVLSPSEALVYWFTYDENGNQVWNIGLAEIIGHSIVVGDALVGTGTRFGDQFNSADVTLESHSTYTIDFIDCDNATVTYFALDGRIVQKLALQRLTVLADLVCEGALPGAEEGDFTHMSNPSDPVLERFDGAGETGYEVFGSSDDDGGNLQVDGAMASLTGGDNLRMSFDNEARRYELINSADGVSYVFREDDAGNRSVTALDAKSGQSVTIPLPAAEAPSVAANERSRQESRTKASRDESSHPESSDWQPAEIGVNYCGGPTDLATVAFIVGDRDIPEADPTSGSFLMERTITVPARVVDAGNGAWRYRGDILIDAQELSEIAMDARCVKLPTELFDVCEVLDVNPAMAADPSNIEYCAKVGRELIPVSLAQPITKHCFKSKAAVEGFCAGYKFRDIYDCGLNTSLYTVFRDRLGPGPGSSDIWARVELNGITSQAIYSGPRSYSPDASGYMFADVDISGQEAVLAGIGITPVRPLAGSEYGLNLEVGCVPPGEKLSLKRQSSQETFSCTVNESGFCATTISASDPLATQDLFQITGPNGLNHTHSVRLYSARYSGEMSISGTDRQTGGDRCEFRIRWSGDIVLVRKDERSAELIASGIVQETVTDGECEASNNARWEWTLPVDINEGSLSGTLIEDGGDETFTFNATGSIDNDKVNLNVTISVEGSHVGSFSGSSLLTRDE